ncbi:chromosome segregation protein SMC [Candidatus Pacearchaeota archaeon]|nr:chromosome segregation protein SMC [Candidatus Pacearchaeota archaeon]
MTYVKKLVMKGFKSFARETVMHMDRHVNVIVGPNGSGKSNVTDALCFVLGRLSIKSMRAAKASHLIFSGNKQYKGSNEASVEITFDNKNKTFALDKDEILIRRVVKKNGQSVYKINKETRTRQEVLELLSQAGIDPHGFNIILQGEIERFVKMPAEDRRKVIEEVAGISVYEMRKQKSLKELDRTDARLKQINAVLRERTNYMRNLENEREQALRFKKLESTVKRCKASIIDRKVQEKAKELKIILGHADTKKKEIEKKEYQIQKTKNEINTLTEKVNQISQSIQKSSGLEQDTLIAQISTLKQEIAGMIARKENFENQLNELDRRKSALENDIGASTKEIEEMKTEKGKNTKKDLSDKKKKLEELDELKRKFYLIKFNLSTVNSQLEDKKRQIQTLKNESNFVLEQIESTEKEVHIKETLEQHQDALIRLKQELEKQKNSREQFSNVSIEKGKIEAIQNQIIGEAEKIKVQVSKLDICPLCKTKMTKEHIDEVVNKSNNDMKNAKELIGKAENEAKEISTKLNEIKDTIGQISIEINKREIDLVKIQSMTDRKNQLRRNNEQIKIFEGELKNLMTKKKTLDNKFSKINISEEQYENLRLEVNELARSEERNLGIEITTKQRELERIRLAIKQILRDRQDIEDDLKDINDTLDEKQNIVEEKEENAEVLKRKYQKMFEKKNELQDKIRFFESHLLHQQNDKRLFENDVNNLMIERAQVNARKETFEQEFSEFVGVELISLPIEKLQERQRNSEGILSRIGNVNLRALEVYDGIKAEYDKIKEKVDQLMHEKEEILTIIAQIDRKKKKAFVGTLKDVNDLFSRNFSQLSTKGIVTLEPQDKKEIFDGGLNIHVKVGGGKYFDVTSLSGGEQTLVALSLIFAVQEFRPYCFYIFDEIDAALDRRNSERLAYLLKKYMKEGQYLIITHNDSLISESSNNLYGVTMQEGISKILSLEV